MDRKVAAFAAKNGLNIDVIEEEDIKDVCDIYIMNKEVNINVFYDQEGQ